MQGNIGRTEVPLQSQESGSEKILGAGGECRRYPWWGDFPDGLSWWVVGGRVTPGRKRRIEAFSTR